MNIRKRILIFSVVLCSAIAIVGFKAYQSGWFGPRRLLELDGKPALLFFNVSEGCECQMIVSNNANAQIVSWSEVDRQGVPVLAVDIDQRPDLAQQYDIYRVPTLMLLDSQEKLMWMQDYSIDDERPLDLHQFEIEIQSMFHE
jgi:hypothetical protein